MAEGHMMNRRLLTLLCIIAIGFASMWCAPSTPSGAVVGERGPFLVKRGEGEKVLGMGTIKASPRTGTQGAALFYWSIPEPGSGGVHVHDSADEFFYILSGTGSVLVGEKKESFGPGDTILVPKGTDHGISPASPVEMLFFVDKPGLADEFREVTAKSNGGKTQLTLEEVNAISQKYGTTYKSLR